MIGKRNAKKQMSELILLLFSYILSQKNPMLVPEGWIYGRIPSMTAI